MSDWCSIFGADADMRRYKIQIQISSADIDTDLATVSSYTCDNGVCVCV